MTRGEANRNPGNIRRSGIVWNGMSADQTDPDFIQFETPEYGLRAIAKILLSYAERGLNTVTAIIDTWAPPNENNDTTYVDDCCERTGFTPTQVLVVNDPAVLASLVRAIIIHENGECIYSDAQIATGVAMATGISA